MQNPIINIEVVQKEFEGENKRFVNARHLHKHLGVGRRFATRISERIEKYNFEEGADYFIAIPETGNTLKTLTDGKVFDTKTKKVVAKEYIITIDMAKEIAMVENNDIGRAYRKYFIKVEGEFQKVMQIAFKDPRFINQLSTQYNDTREETKGYRLEFTNSIRDYVDSKNYGIYTDLVYSFLFEERASEYKNLLSLSSKDATRDTMYTDVLIVIGAVEAGIAEEAKEIYLESGKKLQDKQFKILIEKFLSKRAQQIYKKQALKIMVTYDKQLRGVEHKKYIDYKKAFTNEDIQKLLGEL